MRKQLENNYEAFQLILLGERLSPEAIAVINAQIKGIKLSLKLEACEKQS